MTVDKTLLDADVRLRGVAHGSVLPRVERIPIKAQGVLPEGGARILAEIEHVPARIDGEREPVVEAGQLVQEELVGEIRRDEIGEAVRDQNAELAVEGERAAQVAQGFRLAAAAAPAPAAVHAAVEQVVALVRHLPVQGAEQVVDDRARQRRRERRQTRILEARDRRRRVRIAAVTPAS